MKASLQWLQDYVQIDREQDPQILADTLTMAGIPVEEVIRPAAGLKNICTGKILDVVPHPNASRLVVCKIDVQGEKELQIVTGATNVRPGQIVPVAMHGAHLPNGMVIKKSKLRGEVSEGMLCSPGELGISDNLLTAEEREGIFILPEDTPVGIDCIPLLGLDDVVYDFELTPNRADCFCMTGLSREFAVLTKQESRFPEISVQEDGSPVEGRLKITVEDPDLCSRYVGRILEQVEIKPSPLWMQTRLRACGIRPINNVVDVTNYVMLELGQPMHAYDYDTIPSHHIVVRRAKENEVLTTLDDNKRTLQETMLVIADPEKAIGAAGVMGGLETEVTAKTTTVLLEAASFKGSSIRKTARALGLRSEASSRFERGINAEYCRLAIDRAAQLLQEMGACTVAKGWIDVYPEPQKTVSISFTAAQINSYLGTNIPEDEMISILKVLKFNVEKEGDVWTAVVPSWRNDCTQMADISEEIARIYGYENIRNTTPWSAVEEGQERFENIVLEKMSAIMTGAGLSETVTFSFMSAQSLEKLNYPKASSLYTAVPILNPISEEYPLMRTTLIPSLMDVVLRNQAVKNETAAIFEYGAVYLPKALPITELPEEKMMVAGLLYGKADREEWPKKSRNYDFYDVKGLMEAVLAGLGITGYTVERAEYAPLHPGKAARFVKDGAVLCTFGELHPAVIENYGCQGPIYLFEMDLETLLPFVQFIGRYKKLVKFPAVTRDLALLAPADVQHGAVLDIIRSHGGEYLESAALFDLYQGKQVPEGYKSMAYALSFRSSEGTLTDEYIEEHIQAMLAALNEQLHCTLR